jgi:hypothetical protein
MGGIFLIDILDPLRIAIVVVILHGRLILNCIELL